MSSGIAHQVKPTQPPTLSGTGNEEYRPKCGDALRPGSKWRHGSFRLWMHVYGSFSYVHLLIHPTG